MDKKNWYCQLGEYKYRMLNGNKVKVKGAIGATMHFFHLCGKNIIVDCGVGFDRSGDIQTQYVPDGNWLMETRIDLVVLTHKHLDHCGAIPRLLWSHPEALVFMSSKCFKGVRISLEDSLKIWQSDARNAECDDLPVPELVFTGEMLEAFYDNQNLRVFESPYWLDAQEDLRGQWPGWEIGFHDSGHDVGAVSVYMLAPNGNYFYLTGDVASHDQENTRGVLLPDDDFLGDFFDRPGVMVTEATNGGRRMNQSREELNLELGKFVESVKARGGVLLCAEFAGTKNGSMAVKLNNLGYSVVIDGLGRQHVRVEVPDIDQRLRDGRVIFIEERDQNLAWKQRAEYAAGIHGFVPIIASSATLDQGFAASAYAPEILPGEKNAVIFASHIFDDSTAQKLFKIERGRTIKLTKFYQGRIEPVHINVRCEIKHFGFSSHDYQDGLVERVCLVKPWKLIVHHCPSRASFNAFAGSVRRALHHPTKKPIWGLNGEIILI